MTSNQPYLLRAFYEWIVDNNLTPYIVVNALYPGVLVPQEHVRDGQIVLNIAPASCNKFVMGNVEISFDARFGGVPRNLLVPCKAVLAIYAKENGAGTVFTLEDVLDDDEAILEDATATSQTDKKAGQQSLAKKGRPTLTIVK
jgi:stringent starvation protein B